MSMTDTVKESRLQDALCGLGIYLLVLVCCTFGAYYTGRDLAKEAADKTIEEVQQASRQKKKKGIDNARRSWEVEASVKGYGEFSIDKTGKIYFRWKDKVE